MFKLVVFCLFLVLVVEVIGQKAYCYYQEKIIQREGITIQQQGQFTKSFNNYRSGIAMGKIPNWENKGMTASLMNYIQWDNKLAALALECANICPQSVYQCEKIPRENGKIGFIKQSSMLQESNVDELVGLTAGPEITLQLQQGDVTHFGCARVFVEQLVDGQRQLWQLRYRETIVCVFDQNVFEDEDGIIYQGGPIGSQCPNGLSKFLPGLCNVFININIINDPLCTMNCKKEI